MRECSYTEALGKIAWGYLFLTFDVNFLIVNVLPNWLGYLFILQALDGVAETGESTAKLLKPLCLILLTGDLIGWLFQVFVPEISVPIIVGTFLGVINLYMQFQLLTNLANIAEKQELSDRSKRLLGLRDLCTVLFTICIVLSTVPTALSVWLILPVIFMVLANFSLCVALFSYRKAARWLLHQEAAS